MSDRDQRRKEAQEVVALVMPLIEKVLVKQMAATLEEMRDLHKCCSQRGARMQIMRDMFREIDWHHACMERPEMSDWFDENGVPV